MRPMVSRAFGEGATNVFSGVCGIDGAGRGRSRRRREFIDFYDSLLDDRGGESEVSFEMIVRSCSEYMDMNNEMMMAVRRSPWWKKYAMACVVAVVSIASVVAYRFIVPIFAYN